MGFEALLGNDRLKENLAESLAKGRISHFYLISGPKGSGKHTLAKLLAAAILCKGSRPPCAVCDPCRKVFSGTHPDFITVDDPEKKTVTVDLIRQARSDIYVQPNESDHKIYLFPRAQDMGLPGQNALLKVLEEPPAYGVFLLLTDNPDKLLPTVRSRCTELKMLPLNEEVLRSQLSREFPQADAGDISASIVRSGGFLGQARELLEAGEELSQQTAAFLEAFGARDALAEVLQQWIVLLESALASRSGIHAISAQARELSRKRTAPDLHRAILALKTAQEYCLSNVSPAAICGWLAWELRT